MITSVKNLLLNQPALTSALFGLTFPVSSVLLTLWDNDLPVTWSNTLAAHSHTPLLLVIWTAPIVLGIFGGFLGKANRLLNQKMASLELRTLQFNTILDTVADAIITIDKNGMVLSFNRSAEAIFGYNASEIVGQNISRLMDETIGRQHDGFIERYINSREQKIIGQRREVEAKRRDGSVFPALLRVNEMIIDNELFFTGVIEDISQTKNLQTQLDQSQRLEAIGQLASGIAHEINTPVQYIGDNLSSLRENLNDIKAFYANLLESNDDAAQHAIRELADQHDLDFILDDSPKAIQDALEGVERVSEIVKAMKTFSHVSPTQSKQTVNLHDAINSALTISRNTYKYIAEVETDFSPDVGLIECYASELNQVFLNLIINAAHAIEEKNTGKGLIRIQTRKTSAESVEILISDNGAGIPPDIQDKVFNLFFTTKEVGKGTGQGLSLAHNIIVKKHGGNLFFTSQPNVGTTFHIRLPLKQFDGETD